MMPNEPPQRFDPWFDPLPLVVLASGNGTNLQAIMDAIQRGLLPARIQGVITDRPEAGALQRARRAGLPAWVVERGQFSSRRAFFEAVAERIQESGGHLVVLAGFMRILPAWLVQAYRGRVVNIHPSLLPAFPGLEAPRQALEYGVRFTGCTVHFVDEGVDTGPIILQAVVPVYPHDDVESLTARIQEQEHRIYPEALALYAQGRIRLQGRRVIIQDEAATPAGWRALWSKEGLGGE